MTAFSSTKSLKASVASAFVLGAIATTPAFAQFNTTGTYVVSGTDQEAAPAAVVQATGNSKTLAVFQTNVASAFTSNTGGDITFEGTTIANGPPYTTSLTATYGTAQANTLTITQPVVVNTFDPGGLGTTNSYGSYSTGASGAGNETSGTQYLGFSNVAANPNGAGTTTSNFNFVFSQSLSDFGIMAINRSAARPLTFTVTLTNGTVVTPVTGQATSNGSPTFFEYSATGNAKIASINFTTAAGYTRFDDLGFIVAPAAAPEPSQVAGLGLGVLGIGMLALRARRRSVLGS